LRGEFLQEFSDSIPQNVDCSLGGLAQQGLELGERISIGLKPGE
jgi:hypothetical protein